MRREFRRLALIPARGGSKGVLRKNLQILGGQPLIAWSINVAIRSGLFDHVFVSTEDEEIASVSREFGAEIPFMRPRELAADESLQIDVIRHCIKHFEERNTFWRTLTLLQPTCPYRLIEDLTKSHEAFDRSKFRTLISVQDISFRDDSTCYYAPGTKSQSGLLTLKALNSSGNTSQGSRRQDFTPRFWRNGSIYVFRCLDFLESETLLRPPVAGWVMPAERSINIDTWDDWVWAQLLASKGVFTP